ncbi:arylsulfatase [Clostridia bacterium]|nr:arylsulfatase [Clostridia bacterium]
MSKPNVLYIVLDDLGFSHLGCYGSNINTPNLNRLASEGVRYNNFHTTAICSATRASLLTGANHHSVGVSTIVETANGNPNSLGYINPAFATTAEILKGFGYGTYAIGKWHLANSEYLSPAGPYDNWPLAKGFDRYYGFLQALMDQFNPTLVRDNTHVAPPKSAADGYHLSEDLTDNAINFVQDHRLAHGDKPFFLYLAYGAVHAPHHAPREYIDRYKGKFDKGWDKIREEWFENQKRLGIVPADAKLNPRNELVQPWDSLSADEKRLFARYMEAFAGFVEHTDTQIGRLIDHLRDTGELDNTVIVFLSDNGASSEGGQHGRFNTNKGFSATDVSNEVELGLQNIDKIGGEYAFNHYPIGWANAGNTPFQWYKVWTHEGGVRDPLIIRYPGEIKDAGAVRPQFHHVSDITPTILDILGEKKPENVKGIAQKPFEGVSLLYSLRDGSLKSRKTVQYFEQSGHRGIYKDGWKASINHAFNDDNVWELYHVAEDFSESVNVADKFPDKAAELAAAWEAEADKYGVRPIFALPIQKVLSSKGGLLAKISASKPDVTFEFKDIKSQYDTAKALGDNHAHRVIAVDVTRSSEAESGVIIASGDRFGGYTLFVQNNRIYYVYNYAGERYFTIEPNRQLPVGKLQIRLEIHSDAEASSGTANLYVNDELWGKTEIASYNFLQGPFTSIGGNSFTEVSPLYKVPFTFTGKINSLKIVGKAYDPLSPDETARLFASE